MIKRLLILLAAAIVLCAVAIAVANIPDGYLLHPIGLCTGTPRQIMLCKGYNSYSGWISDLSNITVFVGAISLVLGFWHRHNCHQDRCYRVVRHGKTHCKKHEKELAA